MSNTTFLTGNIGKGEVRVTPNGKTVCNFSVADQVGYGDNAKTQWVECALWGKRAENQKLTAMLVKGNQVTVKGTLELVPGEGQYPAKLKMPFVDDIVHVTVKTPNADGGQRQQPAGGSVSMGADNSIFDDSLPF